jgi:sugar O-acyltransferase (sialic acid O-acetyltransferase NeuD family)
MDVLVAGEDVEVVGLIDDVLENAGRRVGELSVIGTRGDLSRLAAQGVEGVVLGFGAAEGRDAVVRAIEAAGLALPTLVHPSASISRSATLAAGVQVLPQVSIGPNARIGRSVLVNTGAIVEHDVTVADFAVINPGAVLTGRVTVGQSGEIGAGAVVLPDIEIGASAIVGAGSVVTHPVCGGETVIGVPARSIR